MRGYARIAPLLTGLALAQGSHEALHPPARKFTLKDFEARLAGGPRRPSAAIPTEQVAKLARNLADNPEQFGTLLDLAGKMLKTIPPDRLPKNLDEVDPRLRDLAQKLAENPQIRERVLGNPDLRDLAKRMGKELPPPDAKPGDIGPLTRPGGSRVRESGGRAGATAPAGTRPGERAGNPSGRTGPVAGGPQRGDVGGEAGGAESGEAVDSPRSLEDMNRIASSLFGGDRALPPGMDGQRRIRWPEERSGGPEGRGAPGEGATSRPEGGGLGGPGRAGRSGRRPEPGAGGNPDSNRSRGDPNASGLAGRDPNAPNGAGGDPRGGQGGNAGGNAGAEAGRTVPRNEAVQQVRKTGRTLQEWTGIKLPERVDRLFNRATGGEGSRREPERGTNESAATQWISGASTRIGGAVSWLRQAGAGSGLLSEGGWLGSMGGGSSTWLRNRLPSGGLRMPTGAMPNLGGLTRSLRPESLGWSRDDDGGGSRGSGSGMVIALLLGVAIAILYGFRRTGTVARGAGGPGAWRLEPTPANEPRERIRWLVERTTLGLLGGESAAQNHLDWRQRLGAELAAGPAGGELAELYERARYLPPDEPLPGDSLDRAEALIRQLRPAKG